MHKLLIRKRFRQIIECLLKVREVLLYILDGLLESFDR